MKKNNKRAIEIGAGAAAAAIAAAAAAYWLSGDKGKARRAKIKVWMNGAKKEIAKNLKTAKKLGREEYDRIVDQAVKKYGKLEDMTAADMVAAAKQLKSEWSRIKGHAMKMVNETRSPARKPRAKKAKRTTSRRKAK